MSKFTDGEWSSNNGSVFSDGECISICQLHGIPKNKADANADLMAAAPDMYRALLSLSTGEGLTPGVTIERILAKARGEIK